MKEFVVVLSNENDLMQLSEKNIYGATFDIFKATKFKTQEEAHKVVQDLGIRFMWPEVYIKSI